MRGKKTIAIIYALIVVSATALFVADKYSNKPKQVAQVETTQKKAETDKDIVRQRRLSYIAEHKIDIPLPNKTAEGYANPNKLLKDTETGLEETLAEVRRKFITVLASIDLGIADDVDKQWANTVLYVTYGITLEELKDAPNVDPVSTVAKQQSEVKEQPTQQETTATTVTNTSTAKTSSGNNVVNNQAKVGTAGAFPITDWDKNGNGIEDSLEDTRIVPTGTTSVPDEEVHKYMSDGTTKPQPKVGTAGAFPVTDIDKNGNGIKDSLEASTVIPTGTTSVPDEEVHKAFKPQ